MEYKLSIAAGDAEVVLEYEHASELAYALRLASLLFNQESAERAMRRIAKVAMEQKLIETKL